MSGTVKFATNSIDGAESVAAAYGADHIVRQVPPLWVVVELEGPPAGPVETAPAEQAAPPAPGQTGDDQLAAAFDRWIELERDHAGSDEVDQLNIEDMQADIVGAVTDTPARPLAGWRAKARILDRLIEQAAREDDPIDDLAASLVSDLVRGEAP